MHLNDTPVQFFFISFYPRGEVLEAAQIAFRERPKRPGRGIKHEREKSEVSRKRHPARLPSPPFRTCENCHCLGCHHRRRCHVSPGGTWPLCKWRECSPTPARARSESFALSPIVARRFAGPPAARNGRKCACHRHLVYFCLFTSSRNTERL